jgi:long-chain acyl-CoA synthetase
VAILAENRIEWALTDLAVLGNGAADVPIYPTLLADAIAFILRDCRPSAIFVSNAAQAAKLATVRADLPFLKHIFCFEPTPLAGSVTFHELLERGRRLRAERGADPEPVAIAPGDLASIIYTSGTTGEPKGVMLSHRNFVSNALTAASLVEIGAGDRCLSFLPLCHVLERTAGLYLMLHAGVGIAYAEAADTVPQDLLLVRPTVVVSVPRLYEKIYARILGTALSGPRLRKHIFFWAKRQGERSGRLEREGRAVPRWALFKRSVADRLVFSKLRERMGGRMRYFVSGGAPLAVEINEFFYAAGMLILEGYGLTETSPILTVNLPGRLRMGSVGTTVPETEVRIAPDGEILARGPQIMLGYFNRPEATRETIDTAGWLHTGDIGRLDEDGFLYITDRKKDLIVTAGGKNIAPQPIEGEFKHNRYISQIVVIGDRRPYLTCLLVPNFENLVKYANRRKIGFTDLSGLVKHPEIIAMYHRQLGRVNSGLPPFNQVKRCAVLDHDFTLEDGELTPTMKVRRRAVQAKYREVIDALYGAPEGQ